MRALRPPCPALLAALLAVLCALAPRPARAQPGPAGPSITAAFVRQSAQRYALSRPREAPAGLAYVRRALAGYDAVSDLINAAFAAHGRFEPDAVRVLQSAFGVGPDGLASLRTAASTRCRAAAAREHVLGRELLQCLGASRTDRERRADSLRLALLVPTYREGSTEEAIATYGTALHSLASFPPDERAPSVRELALMELAAGDLAAARRRIATLGADPEAEILRADLNFVAGHTASAQQLVRSLTQRSPSHVGAHVARAQLAMNEFVRTDAQDRDLLTEYFDHARAALCVSDAGSPRGLIERAILLVEDANPRLTEARPYALRASNGPTTLLVLPPGDLPAWAFPVPLDPQLAVLETCDALLRRVAPGAHAHRPSSP